MTGKLLRQIHTALTGKVTTAVNGNELQEAAKGSAVCTGPVASEQGGSGRQQLGSEELNSYLRKRARLIGPGPYRDLREKPLL